MPNPVYYKKDPNLADLKTNCATLVTDSATIKADVATIKQLIYSLTTSSVIGGCRCQLQLGH